MLTKNETKYIQSLYHKKQRDIEGVFIAEGPKLAAELIESNMEVVHIYATDDWLQRQIPLSIPFTQITPADLSRLSNLQTPNEVVVLARQRTLPAEPVFAKKITLLLDGIQDPGNLGTIIRTADWFGLNQIICSSDSADIYNAKVVQSTMGSITRINCWYRELNEFKLPEGTPVFGALLNGANVFELEKVQEGLLVIGNEAKGIRQPLLGAITHPVTIPKIGDAESLNAAVATGIIIAQMVNSK